MSPAPARTSNDAIVRAARDGPRGRRTVGADHAAGRRGGRGQGSVALQARPRPRGAAAGRRRRRRGGPDARHGPAPRRPTIRRADLEATAIAYRGFVRRNPNGYRLLFTELPSGANPDPAILAALGEPIVRPSARLAGEASALEGARTFVAWAHGFVHDGGGGSLPARWRPRRRLHVRRQGHHRGRQRAGEPSITLTTKRMTKRPTTSASAPKSLG